MSRSISQRSEKPDSYLFCISQTRDQEKARYPLRTRLLISWVQMGAKQSNVCVGFVKCGYTLFIIHSPREGMGTPTAWPVLAGDLRVRSSSANSTPSSTRRPMATRLLPSRAGSESLTSCGIRGKSLHVSETVSVDCVSWDDNNPSLKRYLCLRNEITCLKHRIDR